MIGNNVRQPCCKIQALLYLWSYLNIFAMAWCSEIVTSHPVISLVLWDFRLFLAPTIKQFDKNGRIAILGSREAPPEGRGTGCARVSDDRSLQF
jgi:hypothetical protein